MEIMRGCVSFFLISSTGLISDRTALICTYDTGSAEMPSLCVVSGSATMLQR